MSDFAGGAGQTWDSVVQNWETSELLTSFAVVVADAWSFAYNPKEPPALIWATKKIPMTSEDASFLLTSFQDHVPAQKLGFTLAGVKYFALDLNPRTLHFRKGSAGIVAVRCRGAMVVAQAEIKHKNSQFQYNLYQYTPPTAASSCLMYMDSLADIANDGIPGVHVGVSVGGDSDGPSALDSLLNL